MNFNDTESQLELYLMLSGGSRPPALLVKCTAEFNSIRPPGLQLTAVCKAPFLTDPQQWDLGQLCSSFDRGVTEAPGGPKWSLSFGSQFSGTHPKSLSCPKPTETGPCKCWAMRKTPVKSSESDS